MALSTHQELQRRIAQYGAAFPVAFAQQSNQSTAPSRNLCTVTPFLDAKSTLPGTWIGMGGMDTDTGWKWSPSEAMIEAISLFGTNGSNLGGVMFGWFYRIGSTSYASGSGDNFTHDGATFPVKRTVMGQASVAIPLLPIAYITTAFAGASTAPTYIMKTGAGGTGYVDETGANVVGSITVTMGTNSPGAQTCWVHPVEDGNCSVEDIVAVNVTIGTGQTAGVITWYGFEPLAVFDVRLDKVGHLYDADFGVLSPGDLKPAVAASGTVKAYFGGLMQANHSLTQEGGLFSAFPNV